MPSAGIMGGGVAGLALACLLAQRGHSVTVYERGELGGKLRRFTLDGQAVDTGPSLFTFPGVWRGVLARLGEADPLDLQPLPGLGLHWVQGEPLPLPVPPAHPLYAAWSRYAGEIRFLGPAVETLLTTPPRLSDPRFVRASLTLGRVLGPHLTAGSWLRSRRFPPLLHHALAAHALNAGVGPERGSALYALLPALIAHEVYRPRKGMFALVEALTRFAQARGVTLRSHAPVTRFIPARGEVWLDRERCRHDLLVSALDPTRRAELLGQSTRPGPLRVSALSVSGVALYAGTQGALPLPPTTVVPPTDYAAFGAAVNAGALPPDTLALLHHEPGRRVLSLLLAAPAAGRVLDAGHPWVQGQVRRLEQFLGVPLAPALSGALALSPAYYARGGATGGAIYGRRFPAWRSGPFHPEPYRLGRAFWQVGSGVHPGGGLPAVLGGALIVDELIRAELISAR